MEMDNSTYLANAHAKNRNEWKSADADSVHEVDMDKEPMKMLYVKHDLRGNYFSANGSGDARMKRDILMSEIAKLIVNRTDEVVALLGKYGIKSSARPTYRELIKNVTKGLHRSQKFSLEIANMVAGGRKRSSADGTTTDYAGMIGNTSDLIGGLGNLFGGKKKAKAQAAADKALAARLRAEAELARAKAEAALKGAVKGVSGGKKLGSDIALYIGLGLAGATLVGVGIWYFKFRS